MNRRVLKKKFYQEVIYNHHGVRNTRPRIVLRFGALCLKVAGGALLTLVLAPISLFRPIEIWQMNTRLSKISFFIEDLETGLRDLQYRNQVGLVWVIALYPINYPNKQLAKMYRQHISILGKKQRWIAESARFIWPISNVVKKRVMDRSENKFARWNAGVPSLRFSAGETKKGSSIDNSLELASNQPYICFAISSKKYREKVDMKQSWGTLENNDLISIVPELTTYLPLIKHLTSRNISLVRMGIHEELRLPNDLGVLVKDYAFSHQSEFGDIWLSSNCKYFSTAGSGAWWFGAAFGKSVVLTDSYALRGNSGSNDLFIPQLCWFTHENRYATFEWMAENYLWPLDRTRLGTEYKIIFNTSQEIIDVNNEMLDRLDGKWIDTKEDLALQKRLKEVQAKLNVGDRAPARMGAKFLREHQHLLPQ